MRRCSKIPSVGLICSGLVSMRLVKSKLSPDRTRNEEIQDRQNAFVWSEKHIFRPHQHFTRDPCSWSRPLEESMKKRRKLSLVERIRTLEQREMEGENATNFGSSSPTDLNGARGGTPDEHSCEFGAVDSRTLDDFVARGDYFYTTPDEEPEASPPLQELLDKLQSLHTLLSSPRYEDVSLKKLEHLQQSRSQIVLQVFNRMCAAVVGETISFDALLFSWCLLLQGSDVLLKALLENQTQQDLGCALSVVHKALGIVLREIKECAPIADGGVPLTLEGWIEALDIATHPLTRRSEMAHRGVMDFSQCVPTKQDVTDDATVMCLLTRVMHLTVKRMVEGASISEESEPLDPHHLYLLLRCMKYRISKEAREDPYLQRVAFLTQKAAEWVLATLESAVAPSSRYLLKHALLGKELQLTRNSDSPLNDSGVTKVKPVVLDVCAPPAGVKKPPTAADDALLLTRSCALLVDVTISASPKTQLKLVGAVDAVLRMLSYTPNYDIGVADTLDLICAVMESRCLMSSDGVEARQVRMLLLLSRIRLSLCGERHSLNRLCSCMCAFSPPSPISQDLLREWKRLRGLVMHNLLHCLRAEEVHEFYTKELRAPRSWVEDLAFGMYNGRVPLPLWLDACRFFLNAEDMVTIDCAQALVALRGRCNDISSTCTSSGQHDSYGGTPPLDRDSTRLLAKLLQIATSGRISAEELMSSPNAWNSAMEAVGDTFVACEMNVEALRAARRSVAERQISNGMVTVF
uniref:Uncharacterized protein n=1 Tax=Trypanosoma congolense (strain IL3000) TaxID=1068625 RepID=G0UM28_TRYCI|nr:conserved hypothetical protein [Trypanosoma congolense IL3000]